VVYRAKLHDPSQNFLDNLLPAVYLFEVAEQWCKQQNVKPQMLFLNDLTDFSRKNADPNLVKYFLEVFQTHYPGRLGFFISVNAPWFYEVLWKVVRPWLSNELISKV